MADLLIVGVGNELRGDDAAGVVVARKLRAAGLPALELQGDPTVLLDLWAGRDAVVLVDCVRSGAPAGTVGRLDLAGGRLPPGVRGSTSTHAVGLGEAVELGRALGTLPARALLHTVEGRAFGTGTGLSGAVAAAVPVLVAAVRRDAGGPLRPAGSGAGGIR